VLVYAAGQSLPQAVPTSLLVVSITAIVALLPRLRAGHIAWRIAVLFSAAGAAACPARWPVGWSSGSLTGLLGIGGGFLIIPVLVIVLGRPMATAIGTSLVIVALNSAAGFAAHADDATLHLPVTVAFTAAAAVAALAAGRLGMRLDTLRLRRWFAYLVLVVAAAILVHVGTSLLAS
jgi:uncharacterized membrane protein YfcA